MILAFFTWISVALSSFMDNVPYTVLMIPDLPIGASWRGLTKRAFM